MILINDKKDVCQTIKANYYKTSLANFVRGGQSFAAPGIIECEEDGYITHKEMEKVYEQIDA